MAAGAPDAGAPERGPLHGVRVVEMSSVVLGPYACQTLGDLGADVIKIEPLDGDTNRRLGPYRNRPDMASLFLGCNRNKRSVALDLKHADGLRAALRIVESVDVLVHNFRPQAMRRLGLDYDSVRALNADIVYCGAYGYAERGPYGDKGALDDSIQAAAGIAQLQAMVDGEPRYLPTIVADKTTATMVVQAVLAALFHRQRSGEGQEIEVPMFECMAAWVMTEHLWGRTFEPAIGEPGYVRLMAPHRRPYRTLDGRYLAVLPYWDSHWETFCRLAGHPELAGDPRFASMRARLGNIDESYRVTREIIATRSRDDWLALLADTNVPVMVVNTLDELIDDPHLEATGFWRQVDHPTEGALRTSAPPIRLSRSPASIRRPAPVLGGDTAEVLSEVGFSAEESAALFAAGAALDDTQAAAAARPTPNEARP